MKGALEMLRDLLVPTWEYVTNALVLLVCMLRWLPRRTLHVFLGTYASHNEDVRRAGLVADINALALADSVILLLTSRATFNQAELLINVQGWANLMMDDSADACASLNQNSYTGNVFMNISFTCVDGRRGTGLKQRRISLPLNASNQQQIMPFLQGLHVDCNLFAMSITIDYMQESSAMCYGSKDMISAELHEEEVRHALAEAQGLYRWIKLDYIAPKDTSNCMDGFQAHMLQLAVNDGFCYSFANAFEGVANFPNDLGFPKGMAVVRWLDDDNMGVFLGLVCNETLSSIRSCINSSTTIHAVFGQWEVGKANAPLKGPQEGAFCSPNGDLSLHILPRYPYQCNSGAQTSSVRVLKDQIDALKAVQKFAYFRCLSYDELFAVYVAIIGVLIAVALTTTTLFFTDVLRPMLFAGRQAWLWDTAGQTALNFYSGDTERMQVVFDVVLRCAAAFAAGSVLAMGLIYVPWRAYLNNQGQACDAG